MALFGLFSAIKDHQRFLILYSVILAIIFVIQFITGIVGLSVKNSSSFTSNVAGIVEPMFKYNHSNSETDFYQKTFKCCGWSGYTDYSFLDNSNNTIYRLPISCCKDPKNCNETLLNQTPQTFAFAVGCQTSLIKNFSKVIEVACGILVTMSLITLLSIALSLVLARQVKTGYQFT